MKLEPIVHFCEEKEVVAIAIDAPLTAALSDSRGKRSSDNELSNLLPRGSKWVMSVNSMMAVPVRGQLLAEALSPIVGTILETHPRACLFFAAGTSSELREAVAKYKYQDKDKDKVLEAKSCVAQLWRMWTKLFGIQSKKSQDSHDALDALVCATVAYLYHLKPETLTKLVHKALKRYGRGPFIVLSPDVGKGV